jgi:hypothetical protein
MARGWESKAIESQQEDASRTTARKPVLSEHERERLAQRQTIELSRARLSHDLSRATAPPHRAMLERALADLDAALERLG